MRAALALLVDPELANRLAAVSLRCRDYGFNLRVLRLPAHVSLKQPFNVNDLGRLAAYGEAFARRLEPQPLRLKGFLSWGDAADGGLAVRVVETVRLRQLHTQLNAELERMLGGTQADFDGEAYRFHLTVAVGAAQPERWAQLQTDLDSWKLEELTVANRLALFLYQESSTPDALYGQREYGTYKIWTLQPDASQAGAAP